MDQPQKMAEKKLNQEIPQSQEQTVEVGLETSKETGLETQGIENEVIVTKEPAQIIPQPIVQTQTKDQELIDIENILSDGLESVFSGMNADDQNKFKIKGEEVASRIRQIIHTSKVKVKSILKLIFDWLKMVPGVNRFFLEQEAKIKTDKILEYADKNKSDID